MSSHLWNMKIPHHDPVIKVTESITLTFAEQCPTARTPGEHYWYLIVLHHHDIYGDRDGTTRRKGGECDYCVKILFEIIIVFGAAHELKQTTRMQVISRCRLERKEPPLKIRPIRYDRDEIRTGVVGFLHLQPSRPSRDSIVRGMGYGNRCITHTHVMVSM